MKATHDNLDKLNRITDDEIILVNATHLRRHFVDGHIDLIVTLFPDLKLANMEKSLLETLVGAGYYG